MHEDVHVSRGEGRQWVAPVRRYQMLVSSRDSRIPHAENHVTRFVVLWRALELAQGG